MTKQEILNVFRDINFAYNDSSKYETLSGLIDELLKEPEAVAPYVTGNGESFETAEKFSKDNSFNYFSETSAKTGFNAQNVFIQAAKELYLFQLEYKDRASRIGSVYPNPNLQNINLNANNLFIDDDDDKPRKKKSCC